MFYMLPITKITNEISENNQNVILVGPAGSGKSAVLKALKKMQYSSDKIVVDGTVDNLVRIDNPKVFTLYHTLLLIQKILFSLKMTESNNEYFKTYAKFERKINKLLEQMEVFLLTNDLKQVFIMDELLNNPEILVSKLNNLIPDKVKEKLLIIIDNFDNIGVFDEIYQNYLYYILNKYFHYIITASSRPEKTNENIQVVDVDFTSNPLVIKKILSDTFNIPFYSNLLSDDVIEVLICESHSNINFMLWAFRRLLQNKNELETSEYASFLSEYFTNLYQEYTPRERKLYINK